MSASLNTYALSLVPSAHISEFLQARDLPVPAEPEKAFDLALRSSGVKTQGEFSALMVNLTKGSINGEQLTAALALAFPNDKVGVRHGPYYLSLCRTGKIKVDVAPAKKAGAPKTTTVDPKVTELEAKIATLEARIAKALEATSAKDIKAALNA